MTDGTGKMTRLRSAMRYSLGQLAPFRRTRKKLIEQYLGGNYTPEAGSAAVPLNLIELATNIYSRQLAANNPRVLVTSRPEKLKPRAFELQIAMNHLVQEIDLQRSLRMVVFDALFSIGVAKIGITVEEFEDEEGYLHDGGQPYCDAVHLDDFIIDMTARRPEEAQYIGNRYRMPVSAILESDRYDLDEEARRKVEAARLSRFNTGGDERASSLSSRSAEPAEYDQQVELWDIWLPRENRIITLLDDRDVSIKIREEAWGGPERGPYRLLSFAPVPDNVMPSAPAHQWLDLHNLANNLFNKLGRQAERQKDVTAYEGQGEEDAERLRDAADGELIRMDSDPSKTLAQFKSGGIDQQNLAFTIFIRDMFSYFGGNIDSIGGLGPQHDTARGDALLHNSASHRVADMQEKVALFTEQISRDLAFYLWDDPLVKKDLVKEVGRGDIQIPFTFSQESKEGDLLDYNIDIEPYSLQHQTPLMRVRALTEAFNQFVAPLLPVIEQQGLTIDVQSLFDSLARHTSTPEIRDLIKQADGTPIGEEQPLVAGSQGTKRTESVRINRPGSTRDGKDKAMIGLLTGNGVQDSELGAVGRPTG